MKSRYGSLLGMVAGLLLLPAVASAMLYTLDVANQTALNQGLGAGPYATVDITLDSTGTVATVTEKFLGSYGFVQEALGLNVNGPYTVGAITGSVKATGLTYTGTLTPGAGKMSTFGDFNLTINMKNASTPLSDLTFTMTGKWTDVSQILLNNAAGYPVAAHVKLDGSNVTGYAVASRPPTSNTPIPATAWLLGTGLVGLVGIRRRMNN